MGHWDLLSRLQEGCRKKFFLLLLMCLLSCCKWDAMITSVPLGCLSLRSPSTQQPLNQCLQPSLGCFNAYFYLLKPPFFVYCSADSVLFINFILVIFFKFSWCGSYSHWLIVSTMRLKYSIPSLLLSEVFLLQLSQTVTQSGCDSWSTSLSHLQWSTS